MADRYQQLTGTAAGAFLTRRLGLPSPRTLARYSPGDPLVSGRVLVGGGGRAEDKIVATVSAAGGDIVRVTRAGDALHAIVFDATSLKSTSQLVELQKFLTPVGRSLEPQGRVIVVGTSPALTTSSGAHIAQRALEGFTRSLGKEVGRGSTVQLVYVAPGAEDRLASTLTFLLSAKSAFVSGQVIRVGAGLSADDFVVIDELRPLTGKVALVTGASRGIGEAIARTLHRDGATIVGLDIPQSAPDLHRLMEELDGQRVSLDITAVDAPQRLARSLLDRTGGVDVVVHNAGITRDKKLANMTPALWNSVIDANLRAPELITTELFEQRLVRPNGRIVGVASIAGIAGNAGQTNYATSKAGVIGFVDATAPRAAEYGVTVNAVAPGFIETQMTATLPVVIREAGRRMNSLSQGGLPVDVAETIAWLAHPSSFGVTGNVVRVCGQSLLGA